MAHQWFIKSGAKQHGPFSSSQLKKLAEQGRITPEISVRRGEVGNWVPASKIKGLFPDTRSASPPVEESPAQPQWQPVEEPQVHNASDDPVTPPAVNIAIDDTPAVPPHLKRRSSSIRLPQLSPYIWGGIGAVAVLLISIVGFFAFSGDKSQTTAGNGRSNESNAQKLLSTEQLVAKSESSVAFIKGRLSTGTGFLIQKNILATNRHVIDGELTRHMTIHFPSAPDEKRGPYAAEVLYIDDTIDFALLKVDAPLPPLNCAEAYTFRRGQEILVIGNPGISKDVVLQNAVSRGVMSTQTVIDGQQYNQLGVSINSGNSGGPVLDQSGAVIGVVTLKASEQEGLGFSIPIQAVNATLRKANALSDQEIANTQSMHRARVVYKYVNASGLVYKLGMAAYTEAMATAIDSGLSASTGLTAVRSKIESQIAAYDEVLIGDLKKELSSISTDPNIPDSTRQRTVDFWTNYLELKSYVENPRGSYSSYRAKYSELSDAHDRLAESVKLLLGVSE